MDITVLIWVAIIILWSVKTASDQKKRTQRQERQADDTDERVAPGRDGAPSCTTCEASGRTGSPARREGRGNCLRTARRRGGIARNVRRRSIRRRHDSRPNRNARRQAGDTRREASDMPRGNGRPARRAIRSEACGHLFRNTETQIRRIKTTASWHRFFHASSPERFRRTKSPKMRITTHFSTSTP